MNSEYSENYYYNLPSSEFKIIFYTLNFSLLVSYGNFDIA